MVSLTGFLLIFHFNNIISRFIISIINLIIVYYKLSMIISVFGELIYKE
jgi:hypothetical protein